jgi:hypothetical protein
LCETCLGLFVLQPPNTFTPPSPNLNEPVYQTPQKRGLGSKGKFIKGEDHMFNYCVLSGRLTTNPTLRFFGKDSPVTEFTLQILMENHRWGTIKVQTLSRLAMAAAKHLNMGDKVIVVGVISEGFALRQEIYLLASGLEALREDFKIESEPSGGDLLT